MTVIQNAQLVLETGVLANASLLIEGDKILSFGTDMDIPSDVTIIDAQGAYVGPGFVDIHVHGGGGYTTAESPLEMANFFLKNGTTTILLTPDYCMNLEKFLSTIRKGKAAMEVGKTIAGFYMEGPYMNPKYGASAEFNPWRHPLDPKEYEALVDEAGTAARVWAIAPEREGLTPFLHYARTVNPNVLFAVGHSHATPDEIRALPYHPDLQTHCTNATGRINEGGGCRGTGPDEYCYLDDEMYAELISDSHAIHVKPDIQKLILKIKGIDHVILITDGTGAEHQNPPEYAHVDDLNFDHKGSLSGSKLTMNKACRNIIRHTGCSIVDAFKMASRNPARVLGMDSRIGTIAVGKKANLVFVDEEFNVLQVMLEGKIV